MYSLADLIETGDAAYLRYLSKKTGFIIKPDDLTGHHWFWLHIIHELNKEIFPLQEKESAEAFDKLLSVFGSLHAGDPQGEMLEKRFTWIFKSPEGHVFIPAEIIKTLMNCTFQADKHYVFQIIHRLRFQEQRNLASLLSRDPEARDWLTFEDHPLDMSLVIYMWYAHKYSLYRSGKLLHHARNRFLREPAQSERIEKFPILPQPVLLWDLLARQYPDRAEETQRFYELLHRGGKSFYRSAGLLNQESPGGFVRHFISGLWFPVFRGKYGSKKHLDNIRVVTPSEVLYSLNTRLAEKCSGLSSSILLS